MLSDEDHEEDEDDIEGQENVQESIEHNEIKELHREIEERIETIRYLCDEKEILVTRIN